MRWSVLYLAVWGGFCAVGAQAQTLDCSDRASLPQQALNACAAEDYRQWDTLLNGIYQRVIATLSGPEEERLRAAQRAWITYRDLTCEMERGQAIGGTIAPLLHAECMTRLTERRTRDIEMYLPNQ